MSSHAKYSPSALSRIEKCPASIHGRHIDIESEYASEGTEFAEWCEGVAKDGSIADAPEEFRPYLELYIDLIVDLNYQHKGFATEYVEERLPNENGFSGTPDFAAVGNDGTGIILDIKYGTGVVVAVEDNMQLLSYAALLLESHPELKQFKLVIFQPRLDPQTKILYVSLKDIKEFIARRQQLKDVAESEDGKDTFNAGSHCQFCPRMLDCPVKVGPTRELIETVEGGVSLTPQELFKIVAMEDKVKEVFRDAKAILKEGLKDGSITPEESGFKIIGTLGNRSWSEGSEDDLVSRYGDEVAKTEKIASPSQVEKELRKLGKLDAAEKEFIADRVERKASNKLVPVTNKGQHLFANRNDFEIQKGDV